MPPPTACINPTEPPLSVSVLLLKIIGFDKTYEKRTSACGYDWVISYYPAVWHSGNHWIMLRIALASDSNGLVARFAGSLVGHRDDGLLGPLEVPPVTAEFSRDQAKEFFVMSRPELFRSGYVYDDSFLLELEIAVLIDDNPKQATEVANTGNAAAAAAPPSSDPHMHFGEIAVVRLDDKPKRATAVANAAGNVAVAAAAPSSDLNKHLGELWRSQRGTDVTFLVVGEPIAAHRCVLAARSTVFMAELFGDMRETASTSVVIEDMEPEVFRALMEFIYTDTSPELGGEDEAAKAMAQHLLAAADRYGMESLKLICEEKMCGDISVGTAASQLVLAEQHGCPKLKARCMEFMVATPRNLRAVVATEGNKHLMASCPSVLSDLLVSVVQRYK